HETFQKLRITPTKESFDGSEVTIHAAAIDRKFTIELAALRGLSRSALPCTIETRHGPGSAQLSRSRQTQASRRVSDRLARGRSRIRDHRAGGEARKGSAQASPPALREGPRHVVSRVDQPPRQPRSTRPGAERVARRSAHDVPARDGAAD